MPKIGLFCFAAAAIMAASPAYAGSAARSRTLPSYATLGSAATSTLLRHWYAGGGQWRTCSLPHCSATRQDWGADALAAALFLRWRATHDPALAAVFRTLGQTAPAHGRCETTRCRDWSDVPAWDAVAALRVYEVTGARSALASAARDYAAVEGSRTFSGGACPAIPFQRPFGGGGGLKTLETEANLVKAALLLARFSGRRVYVDAARREYAQIRATFRDPRVALYTVYVLDDGRHCRPLAGRFFASVNGLMIWNGLALADATHDARYRAEAYATAREIDRRLNDARGIFVDLQAENDVVEPLVEAMAWLARSGDRTALHWLERNAGAATGARRPDGSYGRFFDGPPPRGPITAWQTNGGLAIEIVAAALFGKERPRNARSWVHARFVPASRARAARAILFEGRAIAVVGVLGARCCEAGHARVFVDGRETFSRTGIWQNKSSANRALPNSILFAWQWARRGVHTLRFEPGLANPKEGGAFLRPSGYLTD